MFKRLLCCALSFIAIYEENNLTLEYLSNTLSLSLDELVEGAVYATATMASDQDYDTMTEEDKDSIRGAGDLYFIVMQNMGEESTRTALLTVVGAYITSGKVEQVNTALDSAKEQLRVLSQNYSDYEFNTFIVTFKTSLHEFIIHEA